MINQQPLSSRRKFLNYLAWLPLLVLGCDRPKTGAQPGRMVELGPAESFTEGLSIDPIKRIAVKRQGSSFLVLPLVCTHQACALKYEEQEFICPCHGARFNLAGEVLHGPATRNLNWIAAEVNTAGQLQFSRP